jgi:2-C-methyl-D-erythritol 2,4-cyclodiphosphate synthase
MRIGHGFDAHRFGADRPLVLGGVQVAHSTGLLAHSDGDVVLHALCDALLGAAGLGDIGRHFPDTDAAYRSIDSRLLLARVMEAVRAAGFTPVNADITVLAQAPRLADHIDAMRARIARDLGLDAGAVNVKATTTERMGWVGREEGIATHAVVLLERAAR